MRRILPALALASSAIAVVAGCSTAATTARPAGHHDARPPASYYLSLGDSLSQGVQPNSAGASAATRHGYADMLYAELRARHPGLRLVKLGCPGETTATMIKGGICRYPGGSQLAAAVRFLRAHPGKVSLITLDIGANDPDSCLTQSSPARVASCLGTSIPHVSTNLTKILTSLRAAGLGTRIIGMNYYLPTLAQWRSGLTGQWLARLTALAATGYNTVLTHIYRAHGARVADVFNAFHTADFTGRVTLAGLGTLPRNVAAICRWTWECAGPPRGPNIHPNQAGYRVIAHLFVLAGAR